MAITMQDIQDEGFEHALRGYDVGQVDVFLERVANEVDAMNKQIEELESELKEAKDELSKTREELAEARRRVAHVACRARAGWSCRARAAQRARDRPGPPRCHDRPRRGGRGQT